ncbi:Putative restriction endonuclease [Rubrobacter radiotolerans]|uniref:Putative restriction endonuclease n=1 Tax=Rubrobacter radiotolerans TaxID=42256 RepID=A0A023X6G3_RUBRA|nr:Uma2 family endonuclease [Rubrobacter radiotolerans]AHY47565.1 Putative restriction endonuclease [Rubrobacter radiotolerans]MDX5894970.1 Uma2 family endonuclease [Rubrobacter radiotolerans]SMC07165.1 Endonuclease, Uma2 family (restriction endonuclease fold) [Rubrobacter radiotolerans DSM 5868]
MEIVKKRATAEELFRLPDDGYRYELVRGELRQMNPAGNIHGRVAMNFGAELRMHARKNGLGEVYAAETGFKISTDPDTVRAPDVAFISRARLEEVGETEGFWPGAPDLAVEVVSPADTYTEVEEKVSDWLDAGTKLVVILNPRKKTATVHRPQGNVSLLGESDTLDCGDVVEGFEVAVEDLFS